MLCGFNCVVKITTKFRGIVTNTHLLQLKHVSYCRPELEEVESELVEDTSYVPMQPAFKR